MTTARRLVVRDGEERTYHCISRCVRQAFLCGEDPISGYNYEHRKEWIRNRLQFLSKCFAVDICAYAVMSNHMHLVVRSRPDQAAEWTDKEVARRWRLLYPGKRVFEEDEAEEPSEAEIQAMLGQPDLIQKCRSHLRSISWLMRSLNEWIARKANREEMCTGRFWEGRFKCTALLDESSVLACAVYVDLNPIRAKISETPEESNYTSAQDRIQTELAKSRLAAFEKEEKMKLSMDQMKMLEKAAQDYLRSHWLCPVSREGKRRGFLSVSLEQYLKILDWTGHQLRSDKPGKIPVDLAPVLDRMRVDTEKWVETVREFGRSFHRIAGTADRMIEEAQRMGVRWFQGQEASRKAFKVAQKKLKTSSA